MRTYDVPDCIIEYMRRRDLVDGDYHLYGSGRALGWIRMAANELDSLPNELKIAEYHAYAGVSAARTAVDALASWLNLHFDLRKGGTTIDFKKPPFRQCVLGKEPSLSDAMEGLASLAKEVDAFRQRAQHREGLALSYHVPGRWHVVLEAQRQHLPTLLRQWAGLIENAISHIVRHVCSG